MNCFTLKSNAFRALHAGVWTVITFFGASFFDHSFNFFEVFVLFYIFLMSFTVQDAGNELNERLKVLGAYLDSDPEMIDATEQNDESVE